MKVKQFAHWAPVEGSDTPRIAFFECDMSAYGYHVLGEMEIDVPFSVPTREQIVAGKIAGLRAEQGNHQREITRIEGRIQELLCIEHKPENPLEWSKRNGVEEC